MRPRTRVRFPPPPLPARDLAPAHAGAPISGRGSGHSSGRAEASIFVQIEAPRRRFKYVSYVVLSGPERLVADLWKAAPPVRAAQIRRAPDRCLTLGRFSVAGGRVTAAGRERNLFEHSLVVRIRGRDGRLVRERPATAASGRWNVAFSYTVGRSQAGTLEAVALSARDGALDCIVQVRVTLRS